MHVGVQCHVSELYSVCLSVFQTDAGAAVAIHYFCFHVFGERAVFPGGIRASRVARGLVFRVVRRGRHDW